MRRSPFVFLLLLAALQLHAQKSSNGLLWRISGNGLDRPSYLYGTMHVQEKRAFEFSDSVLVKLRECQAFAGELDLDSAMTSMLRQLYGNDSSADLTTLLTPSQYEQLEKRLRKESGLSLDHIRHLKPWMLRYFLSEGGGGEGHAPYKSTFLDAYLYRVAKLERKRLIGIERLTEQLAVFDSQPLTEQVEELLDDTEGGSEREDLYEKMLVLYRQGNLDALLALARRKMSPEYYDRILTQRNYRMAERIDTFIRVQQTFIAIGAGHLPGKEGVLELLRGRGFTVTPVRATYSGAAKWYREPRVELPWYHHSSAEMGLAVDFPLEPVPMPAWALGVDDTLDATSSLALTIFCTVDISTGTTYQAMSLDLPGSAVTDREKIVQTMIERMGGGSDSSLFGRHEVVTDSIPGHEFSVVDEQKRFNRIRLYLRGNRIYMLGASSEHILYFSPDVDRFFRSARFLDLERPVWERVTSEEGAFEIVMPGPPRKQNYTSNGSGSVLMAEDNGTGFFSSASWFDPVAGSVFTDDSATLEKVVESTVSEIGGKLEHDQPVRLDGFNGRAYEASTSEGITVKGRVYLRGSRVYSIAAGGPATPQIIDSAEHLLGSFRFLDYAPTAWRSYGSDSLGFKVDVPALPRIERDESNYPRAAERTQIASQDGHSGQSFTISLDTYSDYYRAVDEESFFRELIEARVRYRDTLLAERTLRLDGGTGREIEVGLPRSSSVYRIRYILQGRRLYQLIAFLTPRQLHSGEADRFFDSFRLPERSGSSDIFSRKTSLLLSDLAGPDTARRHAARDALRWFTIDSLDIPAIYGAIRNQSMEDPESGASERLVALLRQSNDSTTAAFLRESYPHLPEKGREAAIMTLVQINSTESLRAIGDLLPADTAVADSIEYYMFSPLYSKPHNLGGLVPSLLPLLDRDGTRQTVLSLACVALDSNVISPDILSPARDAMLRATEKIIAAREAVDEESGEYRDDYLLEEAAACLGYLAADSSSDRLLDRIIADSSLGVARSAAIAMLRHRVDPDTSHLERIASDPYERLQLYRELRGIGRIDRFPRRFLSQRSITEGEIVEWLYDNEDYSDPEIDIVEERETEINGNKGRAFLFRFHERSDSSGSWYAGLAGMQPLDSGRIESSSDSIRIRSNYTEFAARSIDEHFDELLKPEPEIP
jgi:uncharacterized protein YbaP (TraB family)